MNRFKIMANHPRSIEELFGRSGQFIIEGLSNFQDGLFALNENGDFIYVNKTAANYLGVEPEDLIGKNMWASFPQTKNPAMLQKYSEIKASQQVTNFLWKNRSTGLWFDATVYPSSEGMIVYWRDITEYKKVEEDLRQSREAAVDYIEKLKELHAKLEAKNAEVNDYANKMEALAQERAMQLQDAERLSAIGATAGMVGHDIRNPLQSITGELYLLNDNLAELSDSNLKSEMKESLDSITANIFYINKIVADLQDYARPILPEYSVAAFPNVVVKIFENIRVPESIKFSIKVNDLETLRTDPMLLQRALSNLVTNAIQAMPEGGTLEVTGHPEDNTAIITISDTGVGIPDDVKPKLFTPMMTTKSKGQGFGLAVSKRLIEAMKGTITFESEEGKGTKFIIELPVTKE